MNKQQSKPAEGITWDLTELYKNIDDPQIEKDKNEVFSLIKQFNDTYKTHISTSQLTSQFLQEALRSLEKILSTAAIIGEYASLLHAKDTKGEKIGKMYQATMELDSLVRSQLLWFDLELIKIDDKKAEKLLSDPKLQQYKHYIEKERIFKPYRLNESEETILTKKSQTSSSAFVRLYDETDASNLYQLRIGNDIKKLNESELEPFLSSHPDRKVREAAATARSQGLKEKEKIYTFILNTLVLDKKIDDEIRGYTYPQQETFLSYEIPSETVKTMSETIQNHYTISEKFYQTKKKMLGLSELYEWDRYSMITSSEEKKYSWEEAKNIVCNIYGQFSPEFKTIAEKFITNKWIDAEITPGKRAGAFCSSSIPSKPIYILINFSATMKDVETLAHELGHGIHAYLSRNNTLFSYHSSTAVAEIASVFGEMITFEMLYKEQTDSKVKMNMLGDMLQRNFATIFRQNAFYLFESDMHTMRREKGELSPEDISQVFQKRLQAMFGKGLTLTEGHKYWWMPIMHFYHYNFYVFCYAFGQMLTLALYARYKEIGQDFVKDYTRALSLGGSTSPYEITKTMGVDINAPDFWEKGLQYLETYVDEFIRLSSG